MRRPSPIHAVLVFLLLPVAAAAQSPIPASRDSVYRKFLDFASLVEDASLTPHWMADGRSFWYAEGQPAETEIWKVDPEEAEAEPPLDARRLRAALTPVLGHEPPYQGLPFFDFRFLDEESAIRFELEGRAFRLELGSYDLSEVDDAPAGAPPTPPAPGVVELPSPTGAWTAVEEEHDIHLRATADGRLVQLTHDGVERYAWSLGNPFTGGASWLPDGSRLAAVKSDQRDIHYQPVMHWLKANREEISWHPYPGTGENLDLPELHVIDVLSGETVQVDLGEPSNLIIYPLGWRPDGSELLFLRTGRLMKKVEMLAADPATGSSRVLLTEEQETFVEGLAFNPTNMFFPFSDGSHFIWRSERDGWSHLYLYDREGVLVRQLTSGQAPVDNVVGIDEKNRWVYYQARDDQTRPYDVHLWRVDFDGQQAARLTEATGVHAITLAPGKEYFLDTHSTVDRPPTVELRRADGTAVRVMSRADISSLTALDWRPPEEFTVKAADGETDLYGALFKPFDFDPTRSYPVIDLQYMGNFVQSAPRQFMGTWLGDEAQALTQLGFIVFIVDARGTTGRGKAFQDHTYNNVGRIEVADHVATLRQLAEDRPYMDMTRVGITGYSWGGYFTLRALLTEPDVFHVGVSGAPVVDFMAATRPIEPYMGLPQDNPEGYTQGSNVLLADRLEGKLLITIGTSDINVTFNHSMRMADALIKSNKFFDLLVFPEETHGLTPRAMDYYREARARYFVEHLKPEEPRAEATMGSAR